MSTPWKQRVYEAYASSATPSGGGSDAGYRRRLPYLAARVAPLLPKDRAAEIVDLGCGPGHLVRFLGELGYTRVRGVDISPEQVALARRSGLGNVELGGIVEHLRRNPAAHDAVLMMDVLEHLDRQELFDVLDAAHASLRPGGLLLLHLPNAEGPFGMGIRYGDITHETCFTASSISQCLSVCGFSGVRCVDDAPVVHGALSLARRAVWIAFAAASKLYALAETGSAPRCVAGTMLVAARRD